MAGHNCYFQVLALGITVVNGGVRVDAHVILIAQFWDGTVSSCECSSQKRRQREMGKIDKQIRGETGTETDTG